MKPQYTWLVGTPAEFVPVKIDAEKVLPKQRDVTDFIKSINKQILIISLSVISGIREAE